MKSQRTAPNNPFQLDLSSPDGRRVFRSLSRVKRNEARFQDVIQRANASGQLEQLWLSSPQFNPDWTPPPLLRLRGAGGGFLAAGAFPTLGAAKYIVNTAVSSGIAVPSGTLPVIAAYMVAAFATGVVTSVSAIKDGEDEIWHRVLQERLDAGTELQEAVKVAEPHLDDAARSARAEDLLQAAHDMRPGEFRQIERFCRSMEPKSPASDGLAG